jgi:hypothetical protein
MRLWFYTLFISSMFLTACSGQTEQLIIVEEKHSTHEEDKPSLDVAVKVAGQQAIVSIVTDLIISKANYGKEKKSGEGHIHMYLNNGEKVGVTEMPLVLEELPPGAYTVKFSLHNNDHTPYDVNQTVQFNIK